MSKLDKQIDNITKNCISEIIDGKIDGSNSINIIPFMFLLFKEYVYFYNYLKSEIMFHFLNIYHLYINKT